MRKLLALVLIFGLLGVRSATATAVPVTIESTPTTVASSDSSKRDNPNSGADVKTELGPNGELLVSEVSDGGSPGTQRSGGGGDSGISCVDLDRQLEEAGVDVGPIGIEDDFANPVIDPNRADARVLGSFKQAVDPDEYVVPVSGRLYSPSGKWRYLRCENAAGDLVVEDLVPIGGPAVTLGELATRALGVLNPALPDTAMVPEGKQLVQLPSLFWVDPAYWNAVRVDTQTAGRVSLTMTLVPFESEWDPGDGKDPVICDGPGQVWERGADSENFYCQHTYKTVKGQPFTLTSTVRFRVEVTTNAPEVIAPPTLSRVTTQELGVREIQVVESNGL